jgi:hypothetical protein
MGKVSKTELEQIIRDSHKKLMLKKKEREIREYLKKLPHSKRARTTEYQELKKIVNQRHKTVNIEDSLCSKCDHRCHMFTDYGWCNDPACPCRHCLCPRCDLEYN